MKAHERYLRRALAYVHSARLISDSQNRSSINTQAPQLHLIAQAYELALKGVLLKEGATEAETRKFRHDISKIASDYRCRVFLDSNGLSDSSVFALIEELSKCHNSETDYTLRYPNDYPTMALTAEPLREALLRAIQPDGAE